jgi:hypothetical protein
MGDYFREDDAMPSGRPPAQRRSATEISGYAGGDHLEKNLASTSTLPGSDWRNPTKNGL